MTVIYQYPDVSWTLNDAAAADVEGWNLFATGCSGYNGYHDSLEVQRIDFPDTDDGCLFEDDTKAEGGAWEHVLHRAFGGSPLHCKALYVISLESPREFRRILGILDDAKDYP